MFLMDYTEGEGWHDASALGHRQRLGYVQSTGLAVRAHAAVVVDPVGHVGILLDLGDHDALADGMQGAGGDEEHIALVHRGRVQHLGEGVVLDAALELLFADLMVKPIVQEGAGLAVQHVPHLGLAVLALVLQGILVAGMHLDGQVVLRVDELGQDGEILEPLAVGAQHALAVLLHVLGQGETCVRPVHDGGGAVLVAGEHPGLGQGVQLALDAKVGAQLLAAPDVILAFRLQFQNRHIVTRSFSAFTPASWPWRPRPSFR